MAAALLGALAAPISATASHVRPKSATPKYDQFVVAYNPCTSGSNTHVAPASFMSCGAVPSSAVLNLGSPDATGAPANGVGSQRLSVCCGNADVAIAFSQTDVRCINPGSTSACGTANTAAGPDYAGELDVVNTMRITDHFNNPGLTTPGTAVTFPFHYTAPCANTAATTVGGTCTVNSTFNATIPGLAGNEVGKRANIELPETPQVYDGGPDATAVTNNNTLFEEAGIFIP
jgi:hypothetical protein